jgi:hypothetical protein
MDKFNRSVRRHHVNRLKSKRKHYWGYGRSHILWTPRTDLIPKGRKEMDQDVLGKVVQYPAACSCPSCCNVRRYPWMNEGEGRTIQERRWLEQYREQLEEV